MVSSLSALGVAMLAPMVLVLLLVVAYPLADAPCGSACTASISPIPSRASHSFAWAITSTPSDSRCSGIPPTALLLTLLSVALELALGLLLRATQRTLPGLGARLAMIFPWGATDSQQRRAVGLILNPTYGGQRPAGLGVLQAPKAWLSDTFWTMHVVILADAWKMVPTMTLLLLAGLQPISPDLYEAAEVDGATPWQKFSRHPRRCCAR